MGWTGGFGGTGNHGDDPLLEVESYGRICSQGWIEVFVAFEMVSGMAR
jgi:hypothetical protein